MTDEPLRLTLGPPPKELGARMLYADRMLLAILADRYIREAIDRALDDIEASKQARGGVQASCMDPTFPERNCDNCGAAYRGPAVYCSLDCAVADA